jgi:hypothetical protein
MLTTAAYPQEKEKKKKWEFSWEDLIADTLELQLPVDSTFIPPEITLRIRDNRPAPGSVVGIKQTTKYRYIPVDQFLSLTKPLVEVMAPYLPEDSTLTGDTLLVDNIFIWYDGKPWFHRGWMLNGYSRLIDDQGGTVLDWQWEQRIKKDKRKEKLEVTLGRLMDKWMSAQGDALTAAPPSVGRSPHPYRRQFLFQVDTIVLPDGYILDWRVTLDFPADQAARYIRGKPGLGIYYRKSSKHESVGMGGKQQQWYFRPRPAWLGRVNLTWRMGANNFNTDKFDYMDYWNILMVNVGLAASLEYRPPYHKGLYAGVGIHQNINVLPDVIPTFETGFIITAGVVLP